jgi:hypothetical protein
MDAFSFETDDDKRGKLLEQAREYERLAAILEEMRVRGGRPDRSPRSALMKRVAQSVVTLPPASTNWSLPEP